MICNKCNHKLPNDSEFCQYCGSKIENVKAEENNTPDETELIDVLNKPDITPDDVLSAILKFQTQATINAMEANAKEQPDNESDEDFGLVPEKPIFTLALKSVDGEEEYLNKLRATGGEKIKYTRRGSTSVKGINGMIDIYDTFLPNGQPYKTIYINMYGAKASASVPSDFKFASEIPSMSVKEAEPKVEKIRKSKKPINNKLLITIISASAAIIMVMIPLFFFLFHTHDYHIVSHDAPTCTIAGTQVLECSRCKHSYIEMLPASHQYVITQQTDSTCTSQGIKTIKCSACQNTYSEPIPIKAHNYSSATCTAPQICSDCEKTEGTALGHSNTVVCTRCGNSDFETISLSGTGNFIYQNLNLAVGKYKITIDFQYTDRLSIEIFDGETTKKVYNKGDYTVGVYEVEIYEVASVITDGHIYISSGSSGTREWIITIEAIGI